MCCFHFWITYELVKNDETKLVNFSHLANTIDASDEAQWIFQWPKKGRQVTNHVFKSEKKKT